MTKQTMVLDAAGQAFFARELEHVKARSYDVKFRELTFRSVFPIASDAAPGAEFITYQSFEQLGQARIINNYARDLPRADVAGKEESVKVRSVGISFGYTVKEIQAAQMVGRSLDQRKANAAQRAVETELNRIAYRGDSNHGLIGLLTDNNGIQRVAAPKPWSGAGAASPSEILDQINSWFSLIHDNSGGAEMANRLALPIDKWQMLHSRRFTDGGDRKSIAGWLVENSPYINSLDDLVWVDELKSAVSNQDVGFVYSFDAETIEFQMPEELVFYQEQMNGLEYTVPGKAECGGLIIYYPMAHRIITGLSA